MRTAYGVAMGLAFGALVGVPFVLAFPMILRVFEFYLILTAWFITGAILAGSLVALSRQIRRSANRPQAEPAEARGLPAIQHARSDAVSPILARGAPPKQVPTVTNGKTYDERFALIDQEGRFCYAQIVNGKFQVGSHNEMEFSDLVAFAAAVLKSSCSGRFTRSDGSKHGILGFADPTCEAIAYNLDPVIARLIGLPPTNMCEDRGDGQRQASRRPLAAK